MPRIDFYFDFISPYSYLAATQLDAFTAQNHVQINWLPISLPRLIQLSGNRSPIEVKNKALYCLRDLKRWAAYLDKPFKMIRSGAFDSRPALAIACALEPAQRLQFCMAVFESLWSGAVNCKADDWLTQIFIRQSLPIEWLNRLHQGNTLYEDHAHQAFKAGAFGAPSFILHAAGKRHELFFGLDHLDALARACQTMNSHPATLPSNLGQSH